MAYCNIENSFLGNKLNDMFYERNRNTISNLIESEDFKEWFGKGRVDVEGNPLINEELSFTNQSGEKRAIFDFPVTFEGRGEVYKLMNSLPSVRLYNGQLFINNTVRSVSGDYLSTMVVKAIDVINYYYPKLLSVEIFQRKGLSSFSKDKSIPLPVITVGDNLIKENILFSVHDLKKPIKSEQFSQLRPVDSLISLKQVLDEFRMYGVKESEILDVNNKPAISQTTYDILKSFVKKINPEFRVELVDNLSTSGAAYISDFLIKLDTQAKLEAMPEEVSHFFFEMLPLDHPLRKEMMDTITSFLIYGTTLATYKNVPEYQKDGKVDYDKIKREAAAKLIGEFIYAISENDNSRLETLLKVKDNFIKRWWDKLVDIIRGIFSVQKRERFQAYREAAEAILNEDVEFLTMEDIERNAGNDTYFSLLDKTKIDVEMTKQILTQVTKYGNLEKLQDIIHRFRGELRKNFIKIVKEENFEELKKELQKDENGKDTEINYLSELFDIMQKIDIRESNLNNLLLSDSQILNFSQFLHVIQNIEAVAKAIDTLVDLNTVDGKLESIAELQSFREVYSNFRTYISNDMSKLLANSDVEIDVIAKIKESTNLFAAIEEKILQKLRISYEKFFITTISPYNKVILDNFSKEITDTILFLVKDKNLHPQVILAIEDFKKNIEKKKLNVEDSENELRDKLSKIGISNKVLSIDLLKKLFGKVSELYSANDFMNDFMNGIGKPIDLASQSLHMVSAAIKNHNVMISNIAKFIVDKRTSSEHLALLTNYEYLKQVSPIIDKLKTFSIDEYQAGERITYIDEVVDNSRNENGTLKYKNSRRKIVKFLSPTKNDAIIEKERLLDEKNKLLSKLYNNRIDPNSEEGKKLKLEIANVRRQYIDFNDMYMNSPYTREYRDFQKGWQNNEDFLEIKERWNKISGERTQALETYENDKNDGNAYVEFLIKTRERSDLLSIEGKTEEEVKKIELLKQFFEESSKFRVLDERQTTRNFNLAVNNFSNKLDTAIGEFLRKGKLSGDYSLDTLEETLQDKMRDPTLRIKWKYIDAAFDNDNISDKMVYTTVEVAEAKRLLIDEFKDRNRVKVRTDAYFEYMDKLRARIEELKEKQGLTPIDVIITDLWKEIQDILVAKTDIYGQKNPATLSDEQLYRLDELEDTIDSIKTFTRGDFRIYKIMDEAKTNKKLAKYLPDIAEYEKLTTMIEEHLNGTTPLSQKKMEGAANRLADLNAQFEVNGVITLDQKKAIKDIKRVYKEMASLSEKKPTQAYWEEMERLIPIIETLIEDRAVSNEKNKINNEKDNEWKNLTSVYDVLVGAIYQQNYEELDELINDEAIIGIRPLEFKKYIHTGDVSIPEELLTEKEKISNKFFRWFIESHREGVHFREELEEGTGELINSYPIPRDYTRRLYYSYTDPSLLKDTKGNRLYEVKEAKRFRETKIAEEFYRKQIRWNDSEDMEDWTVGNKGEYDYLPLSKKQLQEEGKTDFKYINDEYYTLKDDKTEVGKSLRDYLRITLKTYLGEQENKDYKIRGFLNLPVTNLDQYQQDKAYVTDLPDRAKRIRQKVAGLFKKNEDTDDAEDQLLGIDDLKDVDEFTQRIIEKSSPALGMNTKLEVQRVNRNVLNAMQQYINRSKDFDARSDLNPFMKGLVDVMKANEELGYRSQKKTREIFEKIYKQMILLEMPDNITNSPFFRKTTNALLSFSGMKLMADVIGGGINYMQANMNNLIESWAKQHASLKNYAVGYGKATIMIGDLLTDFNKKTDFSYWTLMYQEFDFIQGDWQEDMLERTSTKGKQFNWRNILMYPRKNGELHAQSAMAIAILDAHKVENKIDGKMYPMWDIYYKEDGKLKLKDGFYEEETDEQGNTIRTYPLNPVDGREFERVKNLIHGINIDLHGNYAKLNQTEASRHSLGKLMENMKRWFVSNLQRRMGREGIDVSKEDLDQGYYTTTTLAIWNMGKEILKGNTTSAHAYFNYYWNTPRKSANLRRTFADFTLAFSLFFISTVLFGYDNDDPDKNKKLRNSSWLYNEALLLFLRTYAEHTAFIPVPPFGFTEMTRNLLDPFSVAKSTIGNAAGVVSLTFFTIGYGLGIDSLYNDAFYTRDSGAGKGPTLFNMWVPGEKGSSKWITYMAKLFGYNGAQVDPSFYIRNFENLQNRLK